MEADTAIGRGDYGSVLVFSSSFTFVNFELSLNFFIVLCRCIIFRKALLSALDLPLWGAARQLPSRVRGKFFIRC